MASSVQTNAVIIKPCTFALISDCVVCLGTTPKRKEYMYPRALVPLKGRTELEDEFRAQQEQLMSALGQCEVLTEGEEEEKPVDQVQTSHQIFIHNAWS